MNILALDQLTNEKWLNLYAARYEHKGHTGRWVFATRRPRPYQGRACDAVLIVAVLREDGAAPRLVLEKEFRVPVGGYVYGLPAGLLDAGESVETTVRREIREETGLEVTAIHRITPPLYSSSGMTDEAAAMAFVDVRTTPETKQHLESSEDIEVLLLDRQQVGELLADEVNGIDAKAWMACYLFHQMGQVV
jgi:ADP-ribose pyrophosphatase